MRHLHELDFPDYLASALMALARLEVAEDPALAARLIGAARTIRVPLGPAAWAWEKPWGERTLERAQELLGKDAATLELEAGAAAPAEVVAEALAHSASDPASGSGSRTAPAA